MKSKGLVLLAVVMMLFAVTQLQAQWLTYDASVLPSETGTGGDVLDLTSVSDDSPGEGFIQEIIDDPAITGNKILKYLHPDGKTMYRHYFDEAYTDSAFTLVARVKADTGSVYDRAFDLQWRNGNANSRDELRIWPADSTIELEKADVEIKVDMDLYEWHTYRIAVNGDEATVYVDEAPIAVVSGASTSTSGDNYIKIGDGSGDAIGGYVDWVVFDNSGAYAPGEGTAFPEDYYVDGLMDDVQKWLVYDASVLPSETGVGGDVLDLTSVSDNSPGAGFIQEIIDDVDISGNKLLKYLHPDGKTMYRHYFEESYTDSAFTLIARVKADTGSVYDRAFDLQWRNGNANSRDELRIWPADSTIELEKADVEIKVDMNLYEWHTYRIAVNGDEATLYIDENPITVLTGISGSTSGDNYIKIGDGSGDAIGGYVDWVIFDKAGAFAPGEGLEIPETLFVDGQENNVPSWLVYDASVLPEFTDGGGDTLDLTSVSDNSPGAGFIQEIVDDPDIAENKLLKYLHPDGKTMYRHYLDESYTDSTLTMLIRMKGENDPETYDRVFDVQWRNGNAGTREELRVSPVDSTIELEKADISIKLDVDFYEWHTFRIVVTGDKADIYLDENDQPVLSGVSESASTDKYVKIGDGSGEAIGGYVDWFIMDVSGAYAPGAGLPVPGYLQVDTGPEPEIPHWLVYDASILPSETTSNGDTLDLSEVSQDAPGTTFVEQISDDAEIEGNKVLKYLQPDGTKMYRHSFAETFTDSSFTIFVRLKGINHVAYDRVFDIQWRNGNANSREELRIWPADSTLELEKADVQVKVDLNLYSWHSYRIEVRGDSATVFVDERSTPYIAGRSTETSSDTYIKIGDGSGDAIGGYLDWIMVDFYGAHGANDGLAIPEGIYVDPYIAPIEPGWMVYDASVLPTDSDTSICTLDLSDLSQDAPGADMVEEIIDDPDIEGNKIFKYLQPNGTRMYRYSFPEGYGEKAYTMIARIKGEADSTYDRIFDLQWRNANVGSRDELRIWGADSTLELEKSSVEVQGDFSLYEWHTIRVAISGDTSTIYIDENPVPFMVGVSGESNSDNYIKVGDGSGDAIGGYMDWCILDLSGAYGPDEGEPIPEELYVDKINTAITYDTESTVPQTYDLKQNYPNPFNPVTVIPFQLPEAGRVKITIYNTLGQQVAVLADRQYGAGRYQVSFNAANYSSGLYFFRMEVNNFTKVNKMMLLK